MATSNDFPSRHPSRRAQERAPQDEVERWYRLVPPLFHLRPYRADDEDAAIELWLATWQRAYPAIDFAARVRWWRTRWRNELVPNAAIMVAEQAGALVGFVTLDTTGYLDQLVVAPDQWGSELGNALVAEAKRLSPGRITLLVNSDNARAIRFYARNGFVHAGEDVNPTSGRPVLRMQWTGKSESQSN
jgi:putative acetyltransferase